MFISFFTGKVMLFYGITLIMKEKSNASALTRDERRPNLGRETFESGTRDVRTWDVGRSNLGRGTPTNIGNESSATFFSTPHKDFPTHKKQKRKEKTWPTTEYK